MEFIKQIVKAPKSLKEMLHAHMGGPDSPHNHDVLHASDLTMDKGFCPREFALLRLLKRARKGRYVDPCLRYTFDYGNLVEDLIRNTYLRDKAWGEWVCQACGRAMNGREPKEKCDCGATGCNWKYVGVRVTSEKLGLTSGLDLVVDYGPPLNKRIVEIKSISKDDFKKLKAPLAEHTLRTRLYMWISEQMGMNKYQVDTKIAHVLYVIKGYGCKQEDGKMSPFKEYLLKQDESQLEPYIKMADELTLFDITGAMPKPVCPNTFAKRSKSCAVSQECFSGKYPTIGGQA